MALSLLSATCLPYHLSTILRYDTSSSYFERFHFHRLPRSVLAPINFPELWSRIFDQLISLSILEKDIFFITYFYSSSIRGYRAFVNSFSVECLLHANDDYSYSALNSVRLSKSSNIKRSLCINDDYDISIDVVAV